MARCKGVLTATAGPDGATTFVVFDCSFACMAVAPAARKTRTTAAAPTLARRRGLCDLPTAAELGSDRSEFSFIVFLNQAAGRMHRWMRDTALRCQLSRPSCCSIRLADELILNAVKVILII